KADLRIGDERLLDRAVAALVDAGCPDVVAVVRAGTAVDGARAVVNPRPAEGLRSSLRLGIEAAGDADAVVVLLVDMPGVGAEAIRRVIAGWRPGRVALARFAERAG